MSKIMKNVSKSFLLTLFIFSTTFLVGCKDIVSVTQSIISEEKNYAVYLKDNNIIYSDLQTMDKKVVELQDNAKFDDVSVVSVKDNKLLFYVWTYENGEIKIQSYLKNLLDESKAEKIELMIDEMIDEDAVLYNYEEKIQSKNKELLDYGIDVEKASILSFKNKKIVRTLDGKLYLQIDKDIRLLDDSVEEISEVKEDYSEFLYEKTEKTASDTRVLYKANFDFEIEKLGEITKSFYGFFDSEFVKYYLLLDKEMPLSEFIEKDEDKGDLWKLLQDDKNKNIKFSKLLYASKKEFKISEENQFITENDIENRYIEKFDNDKIILKYNPTKFKKLKLSWYNNEKSVEKAVHTEMSNSVDVFVLYREYLMDLSTHISGETTKKGDAFQYFKNVKDDRGDLYEIKIVDGKLGNEEKIAENVSVKSFAITSKGIVIDVDIYDENDILYVNGEKMDEGGIIYLHDSETIEDIYFENKKDDKNTLKVLKDGNIITITDNLNEAFTTKEGNIIYTANFDLEKNISDLYYFDGEKSHLIDTKISKNLWFEKNDLRKS